MSDDQLELGISIPDKLYFRIGEVSELVGVEPHVLRYWEGELKLRPQRSASGQRMYQRRDITRFLRVKQLVHDEGFTVAGARKALRGEGSAPPPMDPARIREALERITGIRRKIQAERERLARPLLSARPADD